MSSLTIEERVAVLEANYNQLHDNLCDINDKVDDIHELSSAIKVIAAETKNISEKVDKIDDRLSDVEKQPAKSFTHYKQLIVGGIITCLVSALVTSILMLVIK